MKRRVKTFLFFSLSGVSIATFLFIFYLSKLDPKDYRTWSDLVESSTATQESSLSEQTRKHLCKELYLEERYIRITADHSTLSIGAAPGVMTLIERCQDAVALLQDKCYYVNEAGDEVEEGDVGALPRQSIRLIKAQKAQFDYTTKELTAESATLYSYDLPEHIPPSVITANPYMQAKAERITAHLQKKEAAALTCHHVHAAISSKDNPTDVRYLAAPLMIYLPHEERVIFEEDQGESVYFYDLPKQVALRAARIEGDSLFKAGQEKLRATRGAHITMKREMLEKIKSELQ